MRSDSQGWADGRPPKGQAGKSVPRRSDKVSVTRAPTIFDLVGEKKVILTRHSLQLSFVNVLPTEGMLATWTSCACSPLFADAAPLPIRLSGAA